MSDKMPMRSLEKTGLRLDVDAITKARLERISGASGLSMNGYANALLVDGMSHIPVTEEDVRRANEIIEENIRNRNAKKAEKGLI